MASVNGDLSLSISESNIDVGSNSSDVTVSVRVQYKNQASSSSQTGSTCYVTCNGVKKSIKVGAFSIVTNGFLDLGSVKFDIDHSNDGSKSVSVSATWTVPWTGWVIDGSASKTLAVIPRASSFTITGDTLGSPVTINIVRKDATFTHDVTFSLGIVNRTYNAQATSCAFTPPVSDATQILTSTSSLATIKVQTKKGTTNIGSALSKTFTIKVPATLIPSVGTVSITRKGGTIPAAWGDIYVRGVSHALLGISGSSSEYGAEIATTTITGGGFASSSSSSSNSLTTGIFMKAGMIDFVYTARDKRGMQASKNTLIMIIDYENPKIDEDFKAYRCNSAGTQLDDGTYIKILPKFKFSSVDGKNGIVSAVVEVANSEHTITNIVSERAYVIGGTISADNTYILKFTIKDALGQVAYIQAIIPTASAVLDFKANKKGIGIGKVAEEDQLIDCRWPIKTPIVSADEFISTSDEGWRDVVYGSGISTYSGYGPTQVRKVGKVVQLRGFATNSTSWTERSDFLTLPAGYYPSGTNVYVQQGSGSNRYNLTVYSSGQVKADRYSNNTNMGNTVPAGTWLCINATWLIE